MLWNVSSNIATCLERAAELRRLAERSADPSIKCDFLALERSWNVLAESLEGEARLERFRLNLNAGFVGLRWPAVNPPTAKDEQSSKPQLPRLIAIVDDDADARDGMHAYVESLGYAGAAFASAEEYLESNINGQTACLILDVHLPGMNGPELQAKLVADGCRTPIVFVTGQFDESIRARVLRAGAVGYLSKPCCERTLVDCLKRALGRTVFT